VQVQVQVQVQAQVHLSHLPSKDAVLPVPTPPQF
jgi:hypothetical protein